jgi:hypothetical protein
MIRTVHELLDAVGTQTLREPIPLSADEAKSLAEYFGHCSRYADMGSVKPEMKCEAVLGHRVVIL